MTTLREEIYNFIKYGGYYNPEENPEEVTDKIISIFEKRIDEMPEQFKPRDIKYAVGFEDACNRIKEMLKE